MSPFLAVIIAVALVVAFIVIAGLFLKHGMGQKLGNRDDDLMLQQVYADVIVRKAPPDPVAQRAGAVTPAPLHPARAISPPLPPAAPLHLKTEFMGHAETLLYMALRAAFPKTVAFSHVSLAQLFRLDELEAGARLGELGALGVDFVICKGDGEKTALGLAIELNRFAAGQGALQALHEKKRELLRQAGIPLIVYDANQLPDAETLRRDVTQLMAEKRKRHHAAPRPAG
ncbi:hypothetical protein AGMMS50225_09200 [Betaproteobacteria bacterium]|nr:hypothetical protein AGMMS50225_09200 [Betaproteobacteria bacterium]